MKSMSRRGMFGALAAGIATLWVKPAKAQAKSVPLFNVLAGHLESFKLEVVRDPSAGVWFSCFAPEDTTGRRPPCGYLIYVPPDGAIAFASRSYTFERYARSYTFERYKIHTAMDVGRYEVSAQVFPHGTSVQ